MLFAGSFWTTGSFFTVVGEMSARDVTIAHQQCDCAHSGCCHAGVSSPQDHHQQDWGEELYLQFWPTTGTRRPRDLGIQADSLKCSYHGVRDFQQDIDVVFVLA